MQRRCGGGLREYLPHRCHIGHELVGTYQHRRVGIAPLDVCLTCKSRCGCPPYLFGYIVGIGHEEDYPLRQHRQHRHVVAALGCWFGHDGHLVASTVRQLCLNVEHTDAVHLVAEEVETEGLFACIRKHIDYAASHCVLPWLVNIVGAHESQVEHVLLQLGHIDFHSTFNPYRAAFHLVAFHHPFGQCFGICDDDSWPFGDAGQHFGAQYLVCLVALVVFYCTPVG